MTIQSDNDGICERLAKKLAQAQADDDQTLIDTYRDAMNRHGCPVPKRAFVANA